MGWLSSTLIGMVVVSHPVVPPSPASRLAPDGVVARCDDFVRVTPSVFTGRGGAWFAAGGQRDYLAHDTFGPGALSIGGVDPALYLQRACTGR